MNPITWIAHLPGPQFLLFYALFSGIVVALAAVWARRLDPLAYGTALPTHPDARTDPYELAWLRAGARGMLTTALVALRQRNLIVVVGDQVAPAIDAPPPQHPVEQVVHGAAATHPTPQQMLGDSRLKGALERVALAYAAKFERAGMVTTASERSRAVTALLVGLALVLGTGGFKLFVALSNGRYNVGFLIVFAIVATIALVVACRPKRLNARGRAYVKSLSGSYSAFRPAAHANASADTLMPLYVAVLGTSVLDGTEYSDIYRLVDPPTSSGGGCSSGSTCSSTSSGSSCSSSSCGGGGCGGGGCGGCGGS